MPPPRARRHVLGWLVLAFFLLLILGFVGTQLWFNAFLRSEKFRRAMSDTVSRVLKSEGDFSAFDFSGATIYSAKYDGSGTAHAFFAGLHADQLRAEINLRGLLHRAWQIDEINIQRANVEMAGPRIAVASSDVPTSSSGVRAGGIFPNRVEIRRALIHETNLTWNGGSFTGSSLTIEPQHESWMITGEGGRCAQSGWPDFTMARCKLRYRSPSLFVSDAELKTAESGTARVDGEISSAQDFEFHVKLDAVPVTPLLRDDWRARLKGKLAGDVHIRSAQASAVEIDGTLSMTSGQLEALPVLDQIALFTRARQFRTLALGRSSANFVQVGNKITVTDFVAESEGLIRIEGSFIVENGEIDGMFQVGVTPSSLQWLPGSQAKVFTVARGGYLWTAMKVTGPIDHPNEDLTLRLAAAAQDAVIDDVEGAVDKAKKDVLDILSPLMR